MSLAALFEPTDPFGDQTVPAALFGCWRRNWIRFGDDGEPQTDVAVIWLQTASGMGDLRIDPKQTPDQTDSSCGITVVDETTTPYMTADWLGGASGFAQQPVSNFPEKGWLDWRSDSLMHELAPSGAYVEEWERLGGSTGQVVHRQAARAATTTNLYIAGVHVFLAAQRSPQEPLHEFSYGIWSPGSDSITIALSTQSERLHQPMNLDFDWRIVSARRA